MYEKKETSTLGLVLLMQLRHTVIIMHARKFSRIFSRFALQHFKIKKYISSRINLKRRVCHVFYTTIVLAIEACNAA